MKDNTVLAILVVFRMVASILCLCGAVWLAYLGKDGYGWLIFLALVFGGMTISYTKSDDNEEGA